MEEQALNQLSVEQVSQIVRDGFSHFRSDPNHPFLGANVPVYGQRQSPFELPPNLNFQVLGVPILSSAILASLYSFGSGYEDGGVLQWKDVITGIRQSVEAELNPPQPSTKEVMSGIIPDDSMMVEQKRDIDDSDQDDEQHSTLGQGQFELQPSEHQPYFDLDSCLQNDNNQHDVGKAANIRRRLLEAIEQLLRHVLEASPFGMHSGGGDVDYVDEDEQEEEDQDDAVDQNTSFDKMDIAGKQDNTLFLDEYGSRWLYMSGIDIKKLNGRKRSLDQIQDDQMKDNNLMSDEPSASSMAQAKLQDSRDDAHEENNQMVSSKDMQQPQKAQIGQMFRGSRAYWGGALARYICTLLYYPKTLKQARRNSVDSNKSVEGFHSLEKASEHEIQQVNAQRDYLLTDIWFKFLLDDFLNRWDLAVRYFTCLYFHCLMKQDLVTFDSQIDQFLQLIFERISIDGNKNAFTPWLPQKKQNVVFKKFVFALVKFPQSLISMTDAKDSKDSSDLDQDDGQIISISKLSRLKFQSQSPTPLEKFKIQFALDFLFECVLRVNNDKVSQMAFHLLLECTSSEYRAKRSESIRVIRRLWTLSPDAFQQNSDQQDLIAMQTAKYAELIESVQEYSIENLDNLLGLDQLVAAEDGDGDGDGIVSAQITENDILRYLDLYVVICVRDPSIFRHLFPLFSKLSASDGDRNRLVQNVILAAVGKIVSFIGMPDGSNKASLLLPVIEEECNDANMELVLKFAQSMVVSSAGVHVKPSSVYVAFFKRLLSEKSDLFIDGRFWACVLPGDDISVEESRHGLISLASSLWSDQQKIDISSRVSFFVDAVERVLLKYPEPQSKPQADLVQQFLHPVDVFVLCHCFDIEFSDKDSVQQHHLSLKAMIEISRLLLTHPQLQRFYTPSVVFWGFTAILDKHGANVPLLFMKAVLTALSLYPNELSDKLLTHVLTRCVSFKTLWLGAKIEAKSMQIEPHNDEYKRAKSLWEGWVRLLNQLTPSSFGLLVRVPSMKMKQILLKCGAETINQFLKWNNGQLGALAPENPVRQQYLKALDVVSDINSDNVGGVVGGEQNISNNNNKMIS
ncbi:hypothetical protein MP228_003388 [Amoeboaphelidium protococcarum]|nr:hypothetical protein MP228_003388 [Amoeboaphelidium protococcarum]